MGAVANFSMMFYYLLTSGDNLALLPKPKGSGGIGSTRHLRDIVHPFFDTAILRLKADGMEVMLITCS